MNKRLIRAAVAITAGIVPSIWFGAFTEGWFVAYGLFVLGMIDGRFLMDPAT